MNKSQLRKFFRNVYKDHHVSKMCKICTKRKRAFTSMNNRYAKRRRVQNRTVHVPLDLQVDLPRDEPNKIPTYKLSDWKVRNKDGTGRYRNMTPSEFQEFKMNLDICRVKILKHPIKNLQKIIEKI